MWAWPFGRSGARLAPGRWSRGSLPFFAPLALVLLALVRGFVATGASGAPPEEDAVARFRVHLEPALLTVNADLTASIRGFRLEKGQIEGIRGPFDAPAIEPSHLRVVRLTPFVYQVRVDTSPTAFWSVNLLDRLVNVVGDGGIFGLDGGDEVPASWMVISPQPSSEKPVQTFQVEIRDLELTYAPADGKLRLEGGGLVLGDERTWTVSRPTAWRFRVKPPVDWMSHLLEVDAGVGEVGLVRDAPEGSERKNPLQTLKLPLNVWRVSGRYGDAGPTIPSLLTPKSGEVVDNGRQDRSDHMIWEFRWTEILGAERYELVFGHGGGELRTVDRPYYRWDTLRTYINGENLDGWTWRVRAIRGGTPLPWSETRGFRPEPADTDPPTPPYGPWAERAAKSTRAPTLLEPRPWAVLDNGREDGRNPLEWEFRWAPVAKADEYELFVFRCGLRLYERIQRHRAKRGLPESVVRLGQDTPEEGWVFSAREPLLLRERTKKTAFRFDGQGFRAVGIGRVGWIWMVRAWSQGQPLGLSEARAFDLEPLDTDPPVGVPGTATPAGPAPALLSPAPGARLENRRIWPDNPGGSCRWHFSWSQVPHATAYEIELARRGALGDIARVFRTATTTYRHETEGHQALLGSECFDRTWRVRAIVGGEPQAWSESRSFDVDPPGQTYGR